MHFDSGTAYVDAGVGVNEDVATLTNDAAWVLDGATGLTDEQYTPCETDATWYVKQVDAYLRAHACDDAPLTEILRDCVEHVAAEFAALVDDPDAVDAADEPSAAIALVRWDEEGVEFVVLGDASFVVRRGREFDATFGQGPRHMDESALIQLERRKTADGKTHAEAFEAILPTLETMRRAKNTLDGYWTLSLDPDAVDHARSGERPGVSDCCLFTDGFEPLVRPYDVFRDWGKASAFIRQEGPAAAMDRIRTIERNDPECEQHPRFKQYDDAAVVSVSFDAQ